MTSAVLNRFPSNCRHVQNVQYQPENTRPKTGSRAKPCPRRQSYEQSVPPPRQCRTLPRQGSARQNRVRVPLPDELQTVHHQRHQSRTGETPTATTITRRCPVNNHEALSRFDPDGPNLVIEGNSLHVLPRLPENTFRLIYIDPPFNTGKTRRKATIRTVTDPEGDRTGFGQRRYRTTKTNSLSYADVHSDYLGFMETCARQARRLLTDDGTFYFHVDRREVHYCRVLLDSMFGPGCFLNEIIWAYDYGGRPRRKWPAKHDNILVYAKTPNGHFFDPSIPNGVPYRVPGLTENVPLGVGDVWWHTIVPTNSREKTGYPTQKPEGILRRVVAASSQRGDWVLDFFAGSGTTGTAAAALGRRFVLVDDNPEAVAVMRSRLARYTPAFDGPADGRVARRR